MTGYFQGNFAAIAKTLKRDTVVKVRKQFVANRDHERPKFIATGVRSLQPNDLDFIEYELLKTAKFRSRRCKHCCNKSYSEKIYARRRMVQEENDSSCCRKVY